MPFVVNEANFQHEVIEANTPVLVHFWTPWCSLCKLVSPMLEAMQGHSNEQIKLVSINADENFKLTNTYRLRNLPTILLFNNGELIEKLDNLNSRDRLDLILERIINNTLSLTQS